MRRLGGRRIAVTGASGLVGRGLVDALFEHGAHPVAVVRNPARAESLQHKGAEVREADVRDPDALTRAFDGVDGVFANAGLVSIGQYSLRTLVQVNVEGTANVMRAMDRAGVTRVVLTSSATVYRPRRDHYYREDHPIRAPGDRVTPLGYYALSKAMAEREAWRLSEQLGLQLSIARPQQIHGPFDETGFMFWTRLLMRPPVSVYPTRMRLPSVYVGDLAEAMCRMMERPVAIGKAYNIAGDPRPTYWDLLEAYVAAGGHRARWVLPLPVPLERHYDTRRAEQDLDFRNRPLVETFAELLHSERALRDPKRGLRPRRAILRRQ